MDAKLLAWGLAAAARFRGGRIPSLWLFTDSRRLPDPLTSIARLPRGRAGVVFRNDGNINRLALGLAIARLCRNRRLCLVVAGDARLAIRLKAGMHLRAGCWPNAVRAQGFRTSSAHGLVDIKRAQRAGADLIFLSPAFATASHPGAAGLGAVCWSSLARRATVPIAALGGIDGASVRRLPNRYRRAAGAIGALA